MCFFKRVLPFVIAFILGVALSGPPPRRSACVYFHADDERLTKPAIVRSLPDASYTEEARRNRFEGVIRLQVLCDAQGIVSEIEPETLLPYGLTEEAMRAAQKIQFIPAMRHGHRASVWVPVEYSFRSWPAETYATGFAFLPEMNPEKWVLESQLNDSRSGQRF